MTDAFKWLEEIVNGLLQASPPVLMAGLLLILGIGIKKSPLADWMIMPILGLLGGAGYPFVAMALDEGLTLRKLPVLVVQGIAIGAVPTFLHQMVKQFKERPRHDDGGTKFIQREDAAKLPISGQGVIVPGTEAGPK